MLHVAAWLLLPTVAAMPHFDIDLDLPPKKRWLNVTQHYKQEIISMMQTWDAQLKETMEDSEKADWLQYATVKSDEYQEEMQGIYEELGPNLTFGLDALHLFNLLYEMGSPTISACSGLLAADENGKVIHGRNMDYSFKFQMPDGSVKDWPDVTFEAYFWKDGKPIFMTIQWALFIGVHSGMRFNGWTFEQNTRLGLNDATLNLAAAKEGGQPFGFVVRKLLENVPDFETALTKINATSFMAPQYFVMAGAKPNEGAIVSMDRTAAQSSPGTPPVQRFGDGEGPWYLLQTNDDENKMPLDMRRPVTKVTLGLFNQQDVSINLVWDVVHHRPLKNSLTVFTWVAVPSTNYTQAVLPGEEPVLEPENKTVALIALETEEVQLLQRFLSRHRSRPGWTHVISQHGLHLKAE